MASGKVKWFNNAKGYGFIIEDGKDEDLFAHYSAIAMEGYKTLKAGQQVSFNVIQGPKGMLVTDIKPVTASKTTEDTRISEDNPIKAQRTPTQTA
ncbi:CspA family cold shock protein [Pseudomonas sp. W4I3]|nr:CspA family cold shock protein [Pseudomonas sp. W4I3]